VEWWRAAGKAQGLRWKALNQGGKRYLVLEDRNSKIVFYFAPDELGNIQADVIGSMIVGSERTVLP
jgi:hypothetical protein